MWKIFSTVKRPITDRPQVKQPAPHKFSSSVARTLLLLTLTLPALADTQYMVDYVLPRGGARGATVTAEFHGRQLDNPKEILFYQPGITAATFTPFAKPGDGFKVKFQIAPDCPLGEHVLRVRTATALSDAVTFWVGPYPQIPQAKTKFGEDNSMAKAQPIAMNTTVEGQILPGPDLDRDYYRVQARQGQRISVEVEAARLGTLHFGGENDLAVRILDANDKELARDDDSALYVQDPVLSIVAPKDGAYFIAIQQQVFYPPRQAWYRAHIGDFSRPTAIFPAGGQAGTTIDARILGDPAGERTEQIALPGNVGQTLSSAGAAVGQTVPSAGAAVGQTVPSAGAAVGQTVPSAGAAVGQTLSSAGAAVGQTVPSAGAAVGQTVPSAGAALGQTVPSAGAAVGQTVPSAGAAVGQTVPSAGAAVGQTVPSAGAAVGQTVPSAGAAVGQTVPSAGAAVGQTVPSAGAAVGQTVPSAGAAVGQTVPSAGAAVGQTVPSAGAAVGQTLSSAGAAVGQTVPSAGAAVGQTVPSANFDYLTHGPGITPPPSANVLRVSPYPNVIHAAGDDPTPVPALPAALNGILEKPGQADTYRFSAKKGQKLHFRVYARTLGAPVDAKIWLQAANNPRKLMQADDSRLQDLGYSSARASWHIKDQQDPASVFAIPADGDYILGIEDSENSAGPDHVYRIEIEPNRNTIYTHVTGPDGYQMPRFTGFIVPQGGRWTLDVQLAQGIGNDYKGEIQLEAKGLPRGVTMIAPKFAKGATRMPVQFVAAPDAEPQSALIELLARPVDPNIPLDSASRQGFALTNRSGELPWHFVWLDKYALAVTQPAPFDIELEAPPIPIVQGGDLQLTAKITRHGDFKDAVEIIPDWLPPGVSKGNVVTIPAGKTEAAFPIQANDKAAKGVYRIAMTASTTGGDGYSGVGRVRVSSPFVDLKVAEPYVSVDLQRGSVEQGKTAQIVAILHQLQPFEGKATARLQQLPKGIAMLDPAPQFTAKDTQITFQVSADKDALAGLNKGIVCEITFTEAGQTFKEKSGNGILRVDEAKVTEAAK